MAVAQSRIQDDVHPLLRHPKPIKRDPAKAQHMLSFIADTEDSLKDLQREKSFTTRWLERPMYGQGEASDMESKKVEVSDMGPGKVKTSGMESEKVEVPGIDAEKVKIEEKRKEVEVEEEKKQDNDADLLDRWTNPDRATSVNPEALEALVQPKQKADTFSIRRRPVANQTRPVSYNVQHLLSPEWTASPTAMSPGQRPASSYINSPSVAESSIPVSNVESDSRPMYPQTWPAPPTQYRPNLRTERPVSYQPESCASLSSPQQQRPRPTSFATFHQRNRSSTKIASSRGLRNNSFPNLARPVSDIAPKGVPGESMENAIVHPRFPDDEARLPSPAPPIHPSLSAFELNELSHGKEKAEKKAKKRWSTIPLTIMKFAATAKRKSSGAAPETPTFEVKVDDPHTRNLSEENVHCYEKEARQASNTPRSRLSGINLLPTPTYSPFDINHAHRSPVPTSNTNTKLTPLPLPFAPWADGPPSPAETTDRRLSSGTSSLSPTRRPAQSRLSVENLQQARPTSSYSHRSSVVIPSPTGTAPHHRRTVEVSISPRTTSRSGTPVPDPTCILCKISKPPSEFFDRRITDNCWHEPATCLHCLQAWLSKCVNNQGWDRCTCPECGEHMSQEDVSVFVNGAMFQM